MRVYKCDKCGEVYERYRKNVNGEPVNSITLEIDYYRGRSYDLCPVCMVELAKWLGFKVEA